MQVAVDLVGGDVVETERRTAFGRQRSPVGAGGLQQLIGADDVGLDELGRAIDGAVDVGLSGQMHDGVRLEVQQRLADPLTIGDVGLEELIARVVVHAGQRLEVAGIGQFVRVEHAVPGIEDEVTDQCGTDESGSASNENAHSDRASLARCRASGS